MALAARTRPRLAPSVALALLSAGLAVAPVANQASDGRARAAVGAFLVAGGLAALALLPQAGWAWTLPPQILIGAGLAAALTALTEAAVGDHAALARHAGITIAARHIGVVVGLLLFTPVLVADTSGCIGQT